MAIITPKTPKCRVSVDLSRNVSFSTARSLYVSYIQTLLNKGVMFVYHTDFETYKSEKKLFDLELLLDWLQIISYKDKNLARNIGFCTKIANDLIENKQAYVQGDEVKLYKFPALAGKKWRNHVSDQLFALSTKQIDAMGNITLMDNRGAPTQEFMNVVCDFLSDIDHIYTDGYSFARNLREMVIRCALQYPIPKMYYFGRWKYGDEYLHPDDASMDAGRLMYDYEHLGTAFSQYLIDTCWEPNATYTNFTPLFNKEWLRVNMNNSGRLLCQDVYYAFADIEDIHKEVTGRKFTY